MGRVNNPLRAGIAHPKTVGIAEWYGEVCVVRGFIALVIVHAVQPLCSGKHVGMGARANLRLRPATDAFKVVMQTFTDPALTIT